MAGLQQDEIIKRLSSYLKYCADSAARKGGDDQYMDGVLTGIAMSIGIASGIDGPIDGHHLAVAGGDIAFASDYIEEGPSWL
jgi:hypothetical protein